MCSNKNSAFKNSENIQVYLRLTELQGPKFVLSEDGTKRIKEKL